MSGTIQLSYTHRISYISNSCAGKTIPVDPGRWYVRQVAGYILRASAGWGLLLGLVWVVGLFRMLLAQTDWLPSGIEQKAIATMVFLLALAVRGAQNKFEPGYCSPPELLLQVA